jgi:DNA primase
VTTRAGVRKIRALVGQTTDVLSISDNCDMATRYWESVGTWRPATFVYSGEQETYRVVFASGREVSATADQSWFTKRSRTKLTTLDLEGESVPVMVPPRPEENLDYVHGQLRGIIFGDGTVDTTGAKIHIYGDPDEEVIDLFRKTGHKHSYSKSRGFWYVGRLPMAWKRELPQAEESASFWRGFFAGWMAADGHVTLKGEVMIHNRDRSVFDHCRSGIEKAGIHLINEPVLSRTTSPFDGSKSTLYRQAFKRYSLSGRDFIQKKKRDRFTSRSVQLRTTNDEVVLVEKTGLIEPVYSCREQVAHAFTVNGVLTGAAG